MTNIRASSIRHCREFRRFLTPSPMRIPRPSRPVPSNSSITASLKNSMTAVTSIAFTKEKQSRMEETLAESLVHSLRAAGVNFITYLPETRLSQIIPLLRSDSHFQLAPVGSEAEGVSIAAGAALGGK